MNHIPADVARAQARASHPQASAWVSANAGAGKTHVLVNRLLRLMLAGTAPGRILCLTYTKAAAVEMESRLFGVLAAWTSLNDQELSTTIRAIGDESPSHERLEQARRLFAQALETPGGLKIGTIHAFCESLLHRFPREAGIVPNFAVMDENMAGELMARARDDVLAQAATGRDTQIKDALDVIISRIDERGLDDLIGAIEKRRRDFAPLARGADVVKAAIAALANALDVDLNETEEKIYARAFAENLFPEEILREAALLLARSSANDRKQAQKLQDTFAAIGSDNAQAYKNYLKIFTTNQGDARKDVLTKGLRDKNPALEEIFAAEKARLLTLEALRRKVVLIRASAAVMVFAGYMLRVYENLKVRRNLLDYEDLVEKSVALLQRNEGAAWVLYKLDGGLDHILVDEAQDTTPAQWDVIRALADEFFTGEGAHEDMKAYVRTIFSVGDEKQSIYSFIGADPAGFERMRAYFEARVRAVAQRFEYIPLTLSFRSTTAVLDAVDAVFSPADVRAGLSASDAPITHVAHRAEAPGVVALWPCFKPEPGEEKDAWHAPFDSVSSSSPTFLLAAKLADIIARWLDTEAGEFLHEEGRPVRPGDILILVRRRNAFMEEMISALKRRGIPVAGADRMVLTDQLAVMDLMALARFALLPQDDLNLASLLKSSLIGLSEEEIFTLAYKREGSLFDALNRQALKKARFENVRVLLSEALARADIVPPFEFFSLILEARGGRRRIAAQMGGEALEAVDEFLNQALSYERVNIPSLQGFLHWFEAGRPEIKRDLDHGRDEIRVMTAHGAKGLEAPIVILPDTCQITIGRQDDTLVRWSDHTSGQSFLLWRTRAAHDEETIQAAREQARLAREAEYRRLLYVAMTRARDRLYICGYETRKGVAENSWYAFMKAALSARGVAVTPPFGEEGFELTSGRVKSVAAPLKHATRQHVLPVWLHQKPPNEREAPRFVIPSKPTPFSLPLDEKLEGAALSPLHENARVRAQRGQIIHRLLELLPPLDESEREAAAKRFLALPGHNLDEKSRNEIFTRVFQLLKVQDFSSLFAADSRAEVMLAGRLDLGGGARFEVAGRVDRLVIRPHKILIVDYKTNRPIPQSAAQVLQAYVTQLALYRALLRQMVPERDVRCALLWTEAPLLMDLPDDLLDRALVRPS